MSSLKERAGVKGRLACSFVVVPGLCRAWRHGLTARFPLIAALSCELARGSRTGRARPRVRGAAGVLDALPASR